MSVFSILEVVATLSGIGCVYLQTRERIEAWPLGILSVLISSFIFFHSRLYSDLLLHIIYVFLNVYGWYNWSSRQRESIPAQILVFNYKNMFLAGTAVITLCIILGYTMGRFTNADLYYLDAFTTSGSLVAQYLLARKVIQNWLLWIVVDVVAIPLYIYKGLYFFALLFFIYLVLCAYGYYQWNKGLKNCGDGS